jgi:hypothetical protein
VRVAFCDGYVFVVAEGYGEWQKGVGRAGFSGAGRFFTEDEQWTIQQSVAACRAWGDGYFEMEADAVVGEGSCRVSGFEGAGWLAGCGSERAE